jgi:hypothetical protein
LQGIISSVVIVIVVNMGQANKYTMNQFSDRIRRLSEQKSLLQRKVANQLEINTRMSILVKKIKKVE